MIDEVKKQKDEDDPDKKTDQDLDKDPNEDTDITEEKSGNEAGNENENNIGKESREDASEKSIKNNPEQSPTDNPSTQPQTENVNTAEKMNGNSTQTGVGEGINSSSSAVEPTSNTGNIANGIESGSNAINATTGGIEGASSGTGAAVNGVEGGTTAVNSAAGGIESGSAAIEGTITGVEGAAAGTEGVAAAGEAAVAGTEAAAATGEVAVAGTEAAVATGEAAVAGTEAAVAGTAAGGWIVLIIVAVIALLVGLIILGVHFSNEEEPLGQTVGGVGYSSINATDEEMFLLAALLVHERGGGTQEQMSYVASVVLNRVLTKNYGGDTIKEIIYAPGQFQGVTPIGYEGGHYTSGTGSTWQNQCQAVENYLTNGETGTTVYPTKNVKLAVDTAKSVLANGDTTATATYPNGGATGFATPYYVLSWLNSESYKNLGYFGMFNDIDGKEAGTSGSHYNDSSEKWGSHSYISNKADQEKLSTYVQTLPSSSVPGVTGNVGLGTFTGESGTGYWNTYQIQDKKYKLFYQNYPSADNNWNIGGRGLCHTTAQAILLSCDRDITPGVLFRMHGGYKTNSAINKFVSSGDSTDKKQSGITTANNYLKQGIPIIWYNNTTSPSMAQADKEGKLSVFKMHSVVILAYKEPDQYFIANTYDDSGRTNGVQGSYGNWHKLNWNNVMSALNLYVYK